MTDWGALCRQLAEYDTPTICNVIELFGVQPRTAGFMDKSIRAAFPTLPPMVGFASTATCRTSAPPKAGDAYHHLTQQVERFAELSGPPVVVFQDLDEPPVAATFGEIMCTTYRAFGAVGLITNGPGRDLEQVDRLRFPVFTDVNGVTVIPRAIAGRVPAAAAAFVAAEQIILRALHDPDVTLGRLRAAIAEADSAMEVIRQSL
jgi:regulator of RNase E activity RraA